MDLSNLKNFFGISDYFPLAKATNLQPTRFTGNFSELFTWKPSKDNLSKYSTAEDYINNVSGTPGVPTWTQQNSVSSLATINTNVDPINKFQSTVQDVTKATNSPLDYKFFNTAAQSNPQVYNQYLQNGLTNPFALSDAMWNQYGSLNGQRTSLEDSTKAYVNAANANYSWLQSKLGRAPSQAETLAALSMGQDNAYNAISSNNTAALQPYNSLFI